MFFVNFQSNRSETPDQRYKRRFMRPGRSSGCINCSLSSMQDCSDKLTAAANHVDKMLAELTAIADLDLRFEQHPFPTALSTSTKSLRYVKNTLPFFLSFVIYLQYLRMHAILFILIF